MPTQTIDGDCIKVEEMQETHESEYSGGALTQLELLGAGGSSTALHQHSLALAKGGLGVGSGAFI